MLPLEKPTHAQAEQRMRELLKTAGLAEPDEVRYEFDPDEVVLFFRETRTAIVIELDET